MKNKFKSLAVTGVYLGLLMFSASSGYAGLPEVEGVFGLNPVMENTSIAIWVPLEAGQSVQGITWYNNDREVVYPEVLAVAGEFGQLESIDLATIQATDFSGETTGWSSLAFSSNIASASSGLYIILRIPEGSGFEFEGNGGGCGFGFFDGDVVNNGWASGDGDNWFSFSSNYQIAFLPVMNSDKNQNVIVLELPTGSTEPEGDVNEVKNEIALKVSPNPFNPSTKITFVLENSSPTLLNIYDIRGRLIQNLRDETLEKGEHSVTWSGENMAGQTVPSGIYFLRLETKFGTTTARTTLLK